MVPFFDPHALEICVEPDLRRRFLDSVHESARRGDFLFAFTMWITMGRVASA
ncbi:hypothetical protein [Streptomyces werraensis]|uniref:hypothetical protein n=1 Tax=Streptomyces werraensis TaxID=68284 RepID=UPI0037CFD9F4